MPKYARFDHTQSSPQRVLGWYDADLFDYTVMPIVDDLIAVTEQQWKARMSDPLNWWVRNGVLEYHKPPTVLDTLEPVPTTAELLARIEQLEKKLEERI